MKDLESIYDQKIYPLMQEILSTCAAHKIPVFADFQIGENFYCTSAVYQGFGGNDERFADYVKIAKPNAKPAFAGIAVHDGKAEVLSSNGYSPEQLEALKAMAIAKSKSQH